MSWLSDLLGKVVKSASETFPDRKVIRFLGAGISVADNPTEGSTDVTVAGAGTPDAIISPDSDVSMVALNDSVSGLGNGSIQAKDGATRFAIFELGYSEIQAMDEGSASGTLKISKEQGATIASKLGVSIQAQQSTEVAIEAGTVSVTNDSTGTRLARIANLSNEIVTRAGIAGNKVIRKAFVDEPPFGGSMFYDVIGGDPILGEDFYIGHIAQVSDEGNIVFELSAIDTGRENAYARLGLYSNPAVTNKPLTATLIATSNDSVVSITAQSLETGGQITAQSPGDIVLSANGSGDIMVNDASNVDLPPDVPSIVAGLSRVASQQPSTLHASAIAAALMDGSSERDSGAPLAERVVSGPNLLWSGVVLETPGPFDNGRASYFVEDFNTYLYAFNASTRITGALTLMAWVRVNQLDGGTIIDCTGDQAIASTAQNTLYRLFHTGGTISYCHDDATQTTITKNFNTILPVGQWTHVAITRDSIGTGVKLYVNGLLADSTTLSAAPSDGSQAYLGVGDIAGTAIVTEASVFGFAGGLCDFQVIGAELTLAEIRAQYDRARPAHRALT